MNTIPAYPGSEPVFFAEDENTRMSMAIAKTNASTAGVRKFFESSLTASGWTLAFPGNRARQTGLSAPSPQAHSMPVYLRSGEICCVLVAPSKIPGHSRITLLHKRQGMQ